ncbi:hypothetical protein K7T73_13055 [Bacillus badius]|uniref:hypothetical protein n=1 Tax=Bacillus badius TaxID=1455 RepID=UPI001CBA8941|nr:hypothetical protein [Bacillus badius]UAT29528.1 hypothetical protein K7T73_13055 [Bacillus badius]
MTVKELIEKLKEMSQDKRVEIGTIDADCGEAERVIEYEDHIEIQSYESVMEEFE